MGAVLVEVALLRTSISAYKIGADWSVLAANLIAENFFGEMQSLRRNIELKFRFEYFFTPINQNYPQIN